MSHFVQCFQLLRQLLGRQILHDLRVFPEASDERKASAHRPRLLCDESAGPQRRHGKCLVKLSPAAHASPIVLSQAHFYHGWPFSSLCKSQTESLTEDGVATANKIGAITSDVYYYCLSISSDFLPPVTVQPWYQGTVQQKLVVFYRTVAMIIFAYIVFLYILAPALDFCYHLFFHDYRPANMINETLIEKYDSIDGYIPQVRVAGMAHKTVVACSAPISNLDGGLECAPYLLEWVASKERAGVDAEEEIQAEFSPEEKDTIYRAQNLYFDDQLADVVDNKRALLGRAVQYIFNEETIARANNNKHKSRLRLKDVARAVQSLRRGLSLDRRLQHPGTSLDGPGL